MCARWTECAASSVSLPQRHRRGEECESRTPRTNTSRLHASRQRSGCEAWITRECAKTYRRTHTLGITHVSTYRFLHWAEEKLMKRRFWFCFHLMAHLPGRQEKQLKILNENKIWSCAQKRCTWRLKTFMFISEKRPQTHPELWTSYLHTSKTKIYRALGGVQSFQPRCRYQTGRKRV